MVERIDILPGNQSAIYGSAAIAGVVNIILKKNLEGCTSTCASAATTTAAATTRRLQLSGRQASSARWT
jgi:outer membrane cobalamin receptor